jgi:hypothetical protein
MPRNDHLKNYNENSRIIGQLGKFTDDEKIEQIYKYYIIG